MAVGVGASCTGLYTFAVPSIQHLGDRKPAGFVEPDSQIKRITFTFLELINAEQRSSSTKTDQAFSKQKFHILPIKLVKLDPGTPQMQVRPSCGVQRNSHFPARSSWCFPSGSYFYSFFQFIKHAH